MKRAAAGLLCAVVMLLAAAPAGAQTPPDPLERFLGRPIAIVEIQIEGRVDASPALASLVELKPGEALTLAALRRASDRLHRAPRFEGLTVLAEETPAGLKIIFNLEPTHAINAMSFTSDSDTGIPPQDLDRLIRDRFNGLPVSTPTDDIQTEVKDILREEGYLSASVVASIRKLHDPDRAELDLAVKAGRRTTIAAAEIQGTSPIEHERLRTRLGLQTGAPFRIRAIEVELADIRDELRDKNFLTATAQLIDTKYSDDLSTASVVVRVEAGPAVTIIVKGELPGSENEYIPYKRSGSVDIDLLDSAAAKIDAEWRRRGYKNSRTTHSQEESQGRLTITFVVERGRRFKIERIEWPEGFTLEPIYLKHMQALQVGEWFDQAGVMEDLKLVRASYQERGHYAAVLEPKFEELPADTAPEGRVVVIPNITPGPRAIVTAITFDLGERPQVTEAELRPLIAAAVGMPYALSNRVGDDARINFYYQQHGFLDRVVQIRPELVNNGTEARLTIYAREGLQVRVGEIIVVGAVNLSREEVVRSLTFAEGDIYSETARADSERRLYATTLYRTAQVRREQRLPGETTVRVVVSIEEADLTPWGFGVGVEGATRPRATVGGGVEDRLEFAPRAFVEFGRRGIGGKNRAVNLYARVSFKPKNAPGDPLEDGRGFGFPEYRVTGTYTERFAFGTNADILGTAISEQAIRTSFNFIRRIGSFALIRPVTPRVSVQARYSLEWTRLFDTAIPEEEQPLVDRLFPQVRLSIMSAGVLWDRRDRPLNTRTGEQFDANLDVALKPLGSEVSFIKFFTQASFFRPVGSTPITFASRLQLGLSRGLETLVPILPASHRFFAGGSTSVRGFQLDRLGVEEILNENGLSNGGNAMFVLNVEMRTIVGQVLRRNLTFVWFADTGNVFQRTGDLDLGRLRTAVGVGVRYDSWIGPIRVDFGFKTDRMFFAKATERRWEIHLSIGEVF